MFVWVIYRGLSKLLNGKGKLIVSETFPKCFRNPHCVIINFLNSGVRLSLYIRVVSELLCMSRVVVSMPCSAYVLSDNERIS